MLGTAGVPAGGTWAITLPAPAVARMDPRLVAGHETLLAQLDLYRARGLTDQVGNLQHLAAQAEHQLDLAAPAHGGAAAAASAAAPARWEPRDRAAGRRPAAPAPAARPARAAASRSSPPRSGTSTSVERISTAWRGRRTSAKTSRPAGRRRRRTQQREYPGPISSTLRSNCGVMRRGHDYRRTSGLQRTGRPEPYRGLPAARAKKPSSPPSAGEVRRKPVARDQTASRLGKRRPRILLPQSGTDREEAEDHLVPLFRLHRTDGVDQSAARGDQSRGRCSRRRCRAANSLRSSACSRQRISGWRRSVPVPLHGASTRTWSNGPRSGGRAGRHVGDQRPDSAGADPSRLATSRRSRPGWRSTATSSPSSGAARPAASSCRPGAAQRSATRRPTGDPSMATSCAASSCTQARPSRQRPTAPQAPGAHTQRARHEAAGLGADPLPAQRLERAAPAW